MNLSLIYREIIKERDDIATVNKYSQIADDILTKFVEYVGRYILYYYPLPVHNEQELIQKNDENYLNFYNFKYNDLTFYFKKVGFDGTRAEYFPAYDTIVIYNDEVMYFLGIIKGSVYDYLQEDIPNRDKIRDEVIDAYEKLISYENSDKIKHNLIHELVHYYDDKNGTLQYSAYAQKYKTFLNNNKYLSNDDLYKIKQELYYNSNHEYNAYFLATAYEILEDIKGQVPEWKDMLNKLRVGFPWLDKIKSEQKERFIKRLYNLWLTLKESKEKEQVKNKLYEQVIKFLI